MAVPKMPSSEERLAEIGRRLYAEVRREHDRPERERKPRRESGDGDFLSDLFGSDRCSSDDGGDCGGDGGD